MTLTGNQLLSGFSRFIGDQEFPQGLSTTATGDSTSLIDTALTRRGNDYFVDWYARITENVNGNQYLNRCISDFDASTGDCTVSPAFAGATGSGTDYELHRYSPDEKFSALDEARLAVYPALGQLVYDQSITGDGRTRVFDIPSAIRRGPVDVYIERPVSVDEDWNYDGDPYGNDTSKWTASNCTLADVTDANDLDIIPKYREYGCTSITTAATTAATVTQVVANMANGISATAARDRVMTLARWVYCTEASKVRLLIIDDSGTIGTGDYHGGNGWELLTVEATVTGDNASVLSTRIDIASTANASVIRYQYGWFYFGTKEKVTESWEKVPASHIRRDNTTQQVILSAAPARGLQVRLVGRDILSALGTTAATQATNTMEIDEPEAQMLYAEAAKILYRRGILSGTSYNELAPRIAVVERDLSEMKQTWAQDELPRRVKTLWG